MSIAFLAALLAAATPVTPPACPLVIGHRGASGERPEHTLASYRLAAELGADFVEPDLVMTEDRVLVARHENEISSTTDVAQHSEFADRRTTKTIDGTALTGWFTEDFTAAELRTLRARERLPELRGTAHDGEYTIPTFDEILALVATLRRETGRPIGVLPEIKHPSYFASIGRPMERALVAKLRHAGFSRRTDAAMIQSFEIGNLQALHRLTKLRLVQLVDGEGAPADQPGTPYATMVTPAGMTEIATYAQVIAPAKTMIIPRDPGGRSLVATRFVTDAHAAGLAVTPWTFRRENSFLPLERRAGIDPRTHGDLAGELVDFFDVGVDGVFTDNSREAIAARTGWQPQCASRPR